MFKLTRYVLILFPLLSILGDSLSTYYVIVKQKGHEVNLVIASSSPEVILILNVFFAITLFAVAVYLDFKLRKIGTQENEFLQLIKKIIQGVNVSHSHSLILAFAVVLSVSMNRIVATLNNILVFNNKLGFVERFSQQFDIPNYFSMLIIYSILFLACLPVFIYILNTVYANIRESDQ